MISDRDEAWALVDGCPTPGDPRQVEGVAAALRLRAQQSRDLYDQLQAFGLAVADSGWDGRTADVVEGALGRMGPILVDQQERADTLSLVLDDWAQDLRQAKVIAVDLLQDAEDARRQAEAPETTVHGRRRAEADLAANRAHIQVLADRHRESAALLSALVGDQAPPPAPPIEGLLATMIQVHAPGLLRRPDPDSDGIPEIRTVLESIQGSWIGQAETIADTLAFDAVEPDFMFGGIAVATEGNGTRSGRPDVPTAVTVPVAAPGVSTVEVSFLLPPGWQRLGRDGGLAEGGDSVVETPVSESPRGIAVGLAITISPLSPSSTSRAVTPTPDILRAAMIRRDGRDDAMWEPLEPPVEVLMRGGFGVRRAYRGGPHPGPQSHDIWNRDRRPVVLDRFLFVRDAMVVTADFHAATDTPPESVRAVFGDIAQTIALHHGG